MSASIFFLIVALCICTLVIIQVRNLKMKEKYAALWLDRKSTRLNSSH